MTDNSRLQYNTLSGLAAEHGLQFLSHTNLAPLTEAGEALKLWQEQGFAGSLDYMQRSEELLAQPKRLFPEGRSIAVFTVHYSRGPAAQECPPGFGRVARYAWGRDYHRVLKKRLRSLIKSLETQLGRNIQNRVFTDAVPLLERALAERAGLGFVGKNSMLIQRLRGSYFFISEILWDLEISESLLVDVRSDCGECQRCLNACPTQAFEKPYVLNAARCISYLSIEKKGMLLEEERRALGSWVFGCDVCQEVCPFNHQVLKHEHVSELPEFEPREPVKKGLLDLGMLLKIRSEAAFLKLFAGTPLMRAGRVGLLRNAAAVAANGAAVHLEEVLLDCLESDASPVLRAQALWALCRLGTECNTAASCRKKILDKCRKDVAIEVREEAARILERQEC